MSQRQKINAIKPWVLLAAFSAPPCYSDYVFGHTNNAALGGSPWSMSSPLFPVDSISGLDINGVFYRYTAVKDPNDPYTVSVQNQAANSSGYIFRSTDDWSGGSGGTIQKFIPLPYSPVGNWGDGSIEQVGIGSVEDPIVLYSYRIDTERVQQPEVPDLPTYDPYNVLDDRYVLNALEPTDLNLIQDDLQEKEGEDTEDDEKRLETALTASENALTIANSVTQAAILKSMNTATNIRSYYNQQIAGGVYKETVVLIDKNIPDNRRAFRSLAQDKVHKQMVDSQY